MICKFVISKNCKFLKEKTPFLLIVFVVFYNAVEGLAVILQRLKIDPQRYTENETSNRCV